MYSGHLSTPIAGVRVRVHHHLRAGKLRVRLVRDTCDINDVFLRSLSRSPLQAHCPVHVCLTYIAYTYTVRHGSERLSMVPR